jgi:hypothetical protein
VSGLLDSLALALLPTLIGWMTAPR